MSFGAFFGDSRVSFFSGDKQVVSSAPHSTLKVG